MKMTTDSGLRPRARAFIAALAALGPLLLGGEGRADARTAPAPRPNIVYILADDLGWGDVGWHGSEIKTPNLDELAKAGARLEQFYVQPVCSPTRAALMTGRYPIRHGLQVGVVRPWAQYGLPLEERDAARGPEEGGLRDGDLRQVAPRPFPARVPADPPRLRSPVRPLQRRTRLFHAHPRRRARLAPRRQGQPRRGVQHPPARPRGRRADQRPRSVAAAVPLPGLQRRPCAAPGARELQAPYAHLPEPRRTYAGMLAALDEAVGQVVAAIDAKGLRKDTLFLFSSDNGGPQPGKVTSNGPLRGAKATLYEGGVRVPAFATWEGRIKAGSVVNAPLHIADWYPTLLGLAGAEAGQSHPLDGRDAWPAIVAGAPSPHDAILLNSAPQAGAVRVGDWKLIVRSAGADARDDVHATEGAPRKAIAGKGAVELFNIAEDPYEARNLAETRPRRSPNSGPATTLCARRPSRPGRLRRRPASEVLASGARRIEAARRRPAPSPGVNAGPRCGPARPKGRARSSRGRSGRRPGAANARAGRARGRAARCGAARSTRRSDTSIGSHQDTQPDVSSMASAARRIGPRCEPFLPRSSAAAPSARAPTATGLRIGCHSKIRVYQLVECAWPL